MTTTLTPLRYKEPVIKQPPDLTMEVIRLLKRPNIAGFAFLASQYDHEVQGNSVLKPLQGRGRVNAEATVIKPLLASNKGVIVSQGMYPSYSDIDAYHMAACSIDTAVRNAVAAGADMTRMALLDNFCWCSPDEPERLGQLKRAAQACYDFSIQYQTPFISGKDSMFNDFKGFDDQDKPVKISIPPTLLISAIGVIEDVNQVVSIEAKFGGDLIYLLGETFDELGGSEYLAMKGLVGNGVPQVRAPKNQKLYKVFHQSIRHGLVSSAISLGRGGLASALAKTLMAGKMGAEIDLKAAPGRMRYAYQALFSESQGRILATVNPDNQKRFERIMSLVPCAQIGRLKADKAVIVKNMSRKTIINSTVNRLAKAYQATFEDY